MPRTAALASLAFCIGLVAGERVASSVERTRPAALTCPMKSDTFDFQWQFKVSSCLQCNPISAFQKQLRYDLFGATDCDKQRESSACAAFSKPKLCACTPAYTSGKALFAYFARGKTECSPKECFKQFGDLQASKIGYTTSFLPDAFENPMSRCKQCKTTTDPEERKQLGCEGIRMGVADLLAAPTRHADIIINEEAIKELASLDAGVEDEVAADTVEEELPPAAVKEEAAADEVEDELPPAAVKEEAAAAADAGQDALAEDEDAAGSMDEGELDLKDMDNDYEEDDGELEDMQSSIDAALGAQLAQTHAPVKEPDTPEELVAVAEKPCPSEVIWNLGGYPRCREAASKKFVKTSCCNAQMEASKLAGAMCSALIGTYNDPNKKSTNDCKTAARKPKKTQNIMNRAKVSGEFPAGYKCRLSYMCQLKGSPAAGPMDKCKVGTAWNMCTAEPI